MGMGLYYIDNFKDINITHGISGIYRKKTVESSSGKL